MQDETIPPPAAEPAGEAGAEEKTPAPPKKQRRLSAKLQKRLDDIILRKRVTERVDYKAIARKHKCTAGSLKTLYHSYTKGEIIMPGEYAHGDSDLSARGQHERSQRLCMEYKELLLDEFEGSLAHAKADASEGKQTIKKHGIPDMVRDLKNLLSVQFLLEKGYNAFLEEQGKRNRQAEKEVVGSVVVEEVKSTEIVPRSNDRRILEALAAGGSDA